VRPEAWQPAPRLRAIDEAACDAEVMYPSPRIQNAIAENETDAAFQIACVRAYNDWLSEFCASSPRRFAGVAMLPSVGVAAALDELERALSLPAMRGVLLSRFPHGGTSFSEEDEPFWARCAERGVPVSVHVGLSGSPSGTPALGHTFTNAFTGAFRFYDSPVRLAELVYRRVFDRHPRLQLVFAEVDVGWLPYLKEQLDDRYSRQNPADKLKLELEPSAYLERNVSYTLVKDRYGVRNRHAIGVSQILWSSDFPHASCDHPDYAGAIAGDFAGVPADERHAMLAGNAERLYFRAS
jgi:predicted TIM-barrel fold metal-dependent hydrolase